MTLPNDSILVTPGSGATLASHAISSKEYEAWLKSDGAGSLAVEPYGVWVAQTGDCPQDTVSGGIDNERFYLYNADASLIVDVLSVRLGHNRTDDLPTAPSFRSTLHRISGFDWTGGTTLTPVKADSTFGSLDADITCGWYGSSSSPPTFTKDGTLSRYSHNPQGRWTQNDFAVSLWDARMGSIVLRQNEGIGIDDFSGTADTSNSFNIYTVVFRVR